MTKIESQLSPAHHSESSATNLRGTTAETVQKLFWLAVAPINFAVDFVTQGVSDFFALETLRHGTRIENYLNIRVHGADPRLGGSDIGASKGLSVHAPSTIDLAKDYQNNSKGYFHLLKDGEDLDQMVSVGVTFPRYYCIMASGNSIEGSGTIATIQRFFVKTFNFLFTPTVKFRFTPEEIKAGNTTDQNIEDKKVYTDQEFNNTFTAKEILNCFPLITIWTHFPELSYPIRDEQIKNLSAKEVYDKFTPDQILKSSIDKLFRSKSERKESRFEEDPDTDTAYRTKVPIGTENIGLHGIFSKALQGDVTGRMKENPWKVIWGAFRILITLPVSLPLLGAIAFCHKPHPSSEAK